MATNFVRNGWKQYVLNVSLLIVLVVDSAMAIADPGIPPGETIQPPTRFLWILGGAPFVGFSEKDVYVRESLFDYKHYSSPQSALDERRAIHCASDNIICHENRVAIGPAGSIGWAWSYDYNSLPGAWSNFGGRVYASKRGICPVNLDLSRPTGYNLALTPEDPTTLYGYIACSVPSYPDGEKDLAKPQSCGERTPNPVHIGLGRKEATISIYSTGNSIFPIDFQLYYQHNDSKRSGITWRHSYHKFIVLDGQQIPTSARIYRGQGALLFYKDQTTGEWRGNDDINDLLVELVNNNGLRTGWIYKDRFSDRVENYDVSGKLISIEDRSGLVHTLSYNSSGNLIRVADTFDQQILFTLDAYGNFSTLTDSAGSLYQFTYASNGNLTAVTYPDGKTRTYHYNEQAYTSNTNLPNALTGITDENGVRYATYTYDAQGRAVVTEHAGGADRHVLGYSTDGSNTIVTDPLGSQYTHYFQTILGVAKSTGQSQPAGSG
ncbi:MAG: RHS repeat protein, partial [Nitrosomonas sp.]|nr:RHS repeat protein [Nitrosomonas sp.]MBP6076266.1 RHS repeat protein [Nitrosomonas sp.]